MRLRLLLVLAVAYIDDAVAKTLPIEVLEAIDRADVPRLMRLIPTDELLEAKSSLEGGCGALAHAAKVGHGNVVQYLIIQRKANTNHGCHGGYTPLMLASVCSAQHEVSHNICPPHLAARHHAEGSIDSYVQVVRLLIRQNADVDARGPGGLTALHLAALNGQSLIVKELIHSDADINAKDDFLWTPLMYSVQRGDIESIRILVNEGAWVNDKDSAGTNALGHAAHLGAHGIVAELLALGADCTAIDFYQKTPLDYAKNHGDERTVRLLENAQNKFK